MIPLQEYHKNMGGLTNTRSLTGRIFTSEEQAQNHCQIGNLKLALDVIIDWVSEKSRTELARCSRSLDSAYDPSSSESLRCPDVQDMVV